MVSVNKPFSDGLETDGNKQLLLYQILLFPKWGKSCLSLEKEQHKLTWENSRCPDNSHEILAQNTAFISGHRTWKSALRRQVQGLQAHIVHRGKAASLCFALLNSLMNLSFTFSLRLLLVSENLLEHCWVLDLEERAKPLAFTCLVIGELFAQFAGKE